MPSEASSPVAEDLTLQQTLEAFLFYETRSDKTKAHAWAQTTWILTLSAGLLAFSLNFYADHSSVRGFIVVEWIVALAGIVLCSFLIYTLHELGVHIRNYWTTSNTLAATHPALVPFIGGQGAAEKTRTSDYRAPFPPFCRRLQVAAAFFILAHLGSAALATWLKS